MSQPLAFLGLAWYFYQARGKQPEVVNDVALVDVPVETEVTSAEVQEVSIVAPISFGEPSFEVTDLQYYIVYGPNMGKYTWSGYLKFIDSAASQTDYNDYLAGN